MTLSLYQFRSGYKISKEIKDYFEEIAQNFDLYYEAPKGLIDKIINSWLRRPGLIRRLKITLNESKPGPNKKILDVGCGSGKYVVECAKKGAEVYGIDISKEMIQIAKDFCEINKVHVNLKIGDATGPLPDGFDVVVSLGVFEYFKDPSPILTNMFLSAKSNGKIIFSVPSLYTLQTPLRTILLFRRKVKCYYYNKKKIISLVNNHKEKIKNINYYSYGPGYVISIQQN